MTDDNLRNFWFWFLEGARGLFERKSPPRPWSGGTVGTMVREVPGWISHDFCPQGACSGFFRKTENSEQTIK